jgi:hypothetical protein
MTWSPSVATSLRQEAPESEDIPVISDLLITASLCVQTLKPFASVALCGSVRRDRPAVVHGATVMRAARSSASYASFLRSITSGWSPIRVTN